MSNIYLIKDLSRLSGHSIYTIKFYLKLGLIQEAGRSPQTRFRYFDDTTLEQLSKIRAWRKQRKSLTEISCLLSDSDSYKLQATGSKLQATSCKLQATGRKPQPEAGSLKPGARFSACGLQPAART